MKKNNFSHLYLKNYPRFLRFAQAYVHDKVIAEDIVSESIIYYWEHYSYLNIDINPTIYILTNIKRRSINYLRRERLKQNMIDDIFNLNIRIYDYYANANEDLALSDIFTSEINCIVENTLVKLSKQTRCIYYLSRYKKYSHKEIAIKLGISIKTVESYITKAIKQLRIALKDYSSVS